LDAFLDPDDSGDEGGAYSEALDGKRLAHLAIDAEKYNCSRRPAVLYFAA
jgi:hypothetical protein